MDAPLKAAKADLVQKRMIQAVFALLGRGEALTFGNVARASGVPERTCYRYFPTREALLTGVLQATSEQLSVQRATSLAGLSELVPRLFRGFDEAAPVIRELLLSPEGRSARRQGNAARQRAAIALVAHEAPDLDAVTRRRVAASLQVLASAAAWQAFADYWDFDGNEAAECSVVAAELLLAGARARRRGGTSKTSRPKRVRTATEKST